MEDENFNKLPKIYFYLGAGSITITFLAIVGGIWYGLIIK